MKGAAQYEGQQDGGYSKYDPSGAPVMKHGGNDAKHDGVVSSGEKYPNRRAKGDGRTE